MTPLDYWPLHELAGWRYDEDDNPPVVTEADIDVAAEITLADEDAKAEFEARIDALDCCGGTDWGCAHYGMVA